jgi:hypothetical protein
MSANKGIPTRVSQRVNSMCVHQPDFCPSLEGISLGEAGQNDGSCVGRFSAEDGLKRIAPADDGERRFENNLEVVPQRPRTDILQVEPHHLVES